MKFSAGARRRLRSARGRWRKAASHPSGSSSVRKASGKTSHRSISGRTPVPDHKSGETRPAYCRSG